MSVQEIIRDFERQKNAAKAAHLMRFFRTGKGQYGEGDLFLGLTVPQTRAIAAKHWREAALKQIKTLLQNPYHEIRLCALLMLVKKFETGGKRQKKQIFDFYIKNLRRANNWDLVDLSAYKIAGAWLYGKDQKPLYALAAAADLWEQRAAIVATMYGVKKGYFKTTLDLAQKFIAHKHDLIHKATGWLLREVGKKDGTALRAFLDTHCRKMPRTMLRYAVEKLPKRQKSKYMKRD
ncbi:MAG: DNA alkylation repair protein [Elusimicrobiota bacterium]|jgi:3-methyladenine DNA glycosylase AlkD|nr:DNA alkylation repair protein [Elusimicrobiota bacterium]